jgi:DNA invertase Pin-like site-specific DNA recombinase
MNGTIRMANVIVSRPLRAAIYCRVSTNGQAEADTVTQADGGAVTRETSLDTQEAVCRTFAEEQGCAVEAVFSDIFSGHSLFERPGLSALRTRVAAGGVDRVIVYAMDRLSRKMGVVAFLNDELSEVGCSLVFATEKYTDDSTGKLLQAFMEWRGESEREAFRERSTRGKMAKARAGAFLPGNRVRYGYRWANMDRTRFEPDPTTGEIVRQMFAGSAGGESLRQIAYTLTRQAVPTPSGRSTSWMHSVVRDILSDEMYTGKSFAFRRVGKLVRSRNGRKYMRLFDRPEAERIALPAGTVPALIDVDLFDTVAARLARNKAEATRYNLNPEASLLRSGHVFCGYCGRTMTVSNSAVQYRCIANGHHLGRCASPPTIALSIADEAAWSRVRSVLMDTGIIQAEVERRASDDREVERDVARIDKLIVQLDRKQANLRANLEDLDPDSAAAIRSRLRDLSEAQQAHKTERADAQSRYDRRQEDLARLHDIQEWQSRVSSNIDGLDYQGKRDALLAVGLRMTVWKKGHEPRWQITMDIDPSVVLDSSSTRSAVTCTSTTCTAQSSIWQRPS